MSHAEITASLLMQELKLCYLGSVNISEDRKVKKPAKEKGVIGMSKIQAQKNS